jgi:uncharacterized membrane protein YeiH
VAIVAVVIVEAHATVAVIGVLLAVDIFWDIMCITVLALAAANNGGEEVRGFYHESATVNIMCRVR